MSARRDLLPDDRLFLDVREAAALVPCDKDTLYASCKAFLAGDATACPARRVGRRILIPVGAFARWAMLDGTYGEAPS